MEAFALNPKARIQLRHIGHEALPVLVIDDLSADPEALVAAAVSADWGAPDTTYYPGLNAPAPQAYMAAIRDRLRPSFGRAFGYAPEVALQVFGFFALATWTPDQFGPWQRIPHYDQPFADHLAMVHYLHPSQAGGTGFFRHRATGFEAIDPVRREGYLEQTRAWLDAHGAELGGFTGPDTPGYEMYEHVPFRFNRAVIYPCHVLHCALFDGAVLSPDPRVGRLTLNSFFSPA